MELLVLLKNILRDWSFSRDPDGPNHKNLSTHPNISNALWSSAYSWVKKEPVVLVKGQDFYFCSSAVPGNVINKT
jgi:hypothetical protein